MVKVVWGPPFGFGDSLLFYEIAIEVDNGVVVLML